LDVSDAGAVQRAADEVVAQWGCLDTWVNDAMVSVFSPVAETTPEEYRRVTEVNYLGTVHGTLAALRHMRRAGEGTIIQIGSALVYRSIPLQSAYCASEAARSIPGPRRIRRTADRRAGGSRTPGQRFRAPAGGPGRPRTIRLGGAAAQPGDLGAPADPRAGGGRGRAAARHLRGPLSARMREALRRSLRPPGAPRAAPSPSDRGPRSSERWRGRRPRTGWEADRSRARGAPGGRPRTASDPTVSRSRSRTLRTGRRRGSTSSPP